MRLPKLPKLKHHRTARGVMAAFLRRPRYGRLRFPASRTTVARQGFLGFFDQRSKTLHYWLSGRETHAERLHLFARGLGHYVSDCLRLPRDSETRAKWFAWVAVEADDLAKWTGGEA